MHSIQSFDSNSIAALCDVKIIDTKNKVNFLSAFVRNGLSGYLLNSGDSEMKALVLDEHLIPVIVTDRGDDCYILSPTAHYIKYSQKEISLMNNSVYKFSLLSLLQAGNISFKLLDFNKAVYVNNWLLSTNPPLYLNRNEIINLRDYLVNEFPDKAIVIRSIDSFNKNYLNVLKDCGFKLLINREIHYWDPAQLGSICSRRRRNVRLDMALTEKNDFIIEKLDTASRKDFLRLSEIYQMIYISRHTDLNPRFTAEFMEIVHSEKMLEFFVVKKEDAIVGFISFFENDAMIYSLIMGYDKDMNKIHNWNLYKLLMGLTFKISINRNKRLFLSSGAGYYKRCRGTKTQYEYEAVYVRHLSPLRQLPWHLMHAGMELNAGKYYATNSF